MTAKTLYSEFEKKFPWFVPQVVKYKTNREVGGIDIYLDNGEILNYQQTRKTWSLIKSERGACI